MNFYPRWRESLTRNRSAGLSVRSSSASSKNRRKNLGQPKFLVQGTIYPDVVESSAPDRNKAERIKTHHNVGGLPEDMQFELVEPLRYLFKDEVRAVGEELGLPRILVWRQPFPGPGLTVRCLGEVTRERVSRLQAADAILIEELSKAGFLGRRTFSSNSILGRTAPLTVGRTGPLTTGRTGPYRLDKPDLWLRTR